MIIETQHLSKRYGRHDAVRDISLTVPEGSALALIGANGAGKTTTLRMLLNLAQPSAGSSTVAGKNSRELTAADFARIGYVSENQKLPDGLTVAQYFDYLRPLYPTWDGALEADLRRRFDLPAGRKLGKLSHGTRLKAVLAAALPFRPTLLILDEPLSGLDPLVRDEVMESLLAQAGEMTIVISSHELAEIEGCATDVAFLDRGRLAFQEPMETLTGRFRDVSITLDDAAAIPASLPKTWLGVRRVGHTLQFTDTAFTSDANLATQAAVLGGVKSIDARGMSLRDISKTLMRAYRQEADQ